MKEDERESNARALFNWRFTFEYVFFRWVNPYFEHLKKMADVAEVPATRLFVGNLAWEVRLVIEPLLVHCG